MKTRIKIVEYNSGKKEFVCQYEDSEYAWFIVYLSLIALLGFTGFCFFITSRFDAGNILFTIVIFFVFLQIILHSYGRRWKTFRDNKKEPQPAIFDNMEAAKDFIEGMLQEETDKLYEKQKNQVKSVYTEEYPTKNK